MKDISTPSFLNQHKIDQSITMCKKKTPKHVCSNNSTSLWKTVTHAGCCTHPITPHRRQPLNNLVHNDMNCHWTMITNPNMANITPPLLHIPEYKQPNSSSWSFIQDRHACHGTCTFSPYPSACRATAYSFETQTWERAWGRWEGQAVPDCCGWPHRENRTTGCETGLRGVWCWEWREGK